LRNFEFTLRNFAINFLKINSMKKTITLILSLFFGISAFAQTYTILVRPAGVKEWGYANLKGDLIIDAQYKKCIGFSEDGYAALYDGIKKQFFFINLKGEPLTTEITGFKLIEILGFGMKGFYDGLAAIKVGDRWGYLNTGGKLAIPVNYEKVTVFNSGYAAVQRDNNFFVLDHNGKEYQVDSPGIVDLNEFSEKLASFKTKAGLIGFIDGAGKVAIQPKFQSAGDFHGGLAWAKSTSGKIGYIDPKGEWVIEPKFDAGKNLDPVSGLMRVKTGDKWGYSSKTGNVTYMADSEAIEDFSNGLAKGKKGDKFGFFNNKMEWAIEPQFDGARDFKNSYASVKTGELWGVIDKTGNWVIKPKFDEIKDVEVIR
jgi:hypothetical protein